MLRRGPDVPNTALGRLQLLLVQALKQQLELGFTDSGPLFQRLILDQRGGGGHRGEVVLQHLMDDGLQGAFPDLEVLDDLVPSHVCDRDLRKPVLGDGAARVGGNLGQRLEERGRLVRREVRIFGGREFAQKYLGTRVEVVAVEQVLERRRPERRCAAVGRLVEVPRWRPEGLKPGLGQTFKCVYVGELGCFFFEVVVVAVEVVVVAKKWVVGVVDRVCDRTKGCDLLRRSHGTW